MAETKSLDYVYGYVFSKCLNRPVTEQIVSLLCADLISDDNAGKAFTFRQLCTAADETAGKHFTDADFLPPEINDYLISALVIEGVDNNAASFRPVKAALKRLDSPYKEVFMMHTAGKLPSDIECQLFDRGPAWCRRTYYDAKYMFFRYLKEEQDADRL